MIPLFLLSPTTGKLPRMSASGKRIGRPPKKGTHVSASSVAQLNRASAAGSPPPPGPDDAATAAGGGEGGGNVKRKRKSPHKR